MSISYGTVCLIVVYLIMHFLCVAMYMHNRNMTYNTMSGHIMSVLTNFAHVHSFLKLYIIHALLEMCAYLIRCKFSSSFLPGQLAIYILHEHITWH